ncbi:MAG: T9SS type A sorting domain-containing protein, partial [Lewinella sp.]|nr:T9SS type A sorting domain-containing protein [Lewinella sp.]
SCERTFVARSVLPVTWLDFAARPAGKTALLNWAVEQDALNAGFSIERNDPSVNNWNQIGYVQRDGADGVANYQFTDIEISPGNTYNYRLRQEDSDGAASYSEIRAVTFGAAFGLSVFPNPANNFVILNTGSGVGENLQYVLYDPTGRKVSEGTMNGGQVRINMNQFPTAIYQILVTDGAGYREVARVVKR